MKRQKRMIKKLEAQNKIPESLAPEKIKSMLDEINFANPIIRSDNSSEVKLKSGRNSFLKGVAAAAVFVITVSGAAVFQSNKTAVNTPSSRDSSLEQTADTSGLSGLRGANYKILFNFFKQSSDSNQFSSDAYIPDSYYKGVENYSEYAESYRQYAENSFYANYFDGSAKAKDYLKSAHDNQKNYLVQKGNYCFLADDKGLSVYKIGNGKAKKLDYDFFENTSLKKIILDSELWNKNYQNSPVPAIIDLYEYNDLLAVTFDFNLVRDFGGEARLTDICGVCVYDISDPEKIKLVNEYEQDGKIKEIKMTDSRISIVSNYLQGGYMVENSAFYDEKNLDYVPRYYVNGEAKLIGEQDMYISSNELDPCVTIISTLDMDKSGEHINSKLVGLHSENVIIGDNNIYLFGNSYMNKTCIVKIKTENSGVSISACVLTEHYIKQAYEENGVLVVCEKSDEGLAKYESAEQKETSKKTVSVSCYDENLELLKSKSIETDDYMNIDFVLGQKKIYIVNDILLHNYGGLDFSDCKNIRETESAPNFIYGWGLNYLDEKNMLNCNIFSEPQSIQVVSAKSDDDKKHEPTDEENEEFETADSEIKNNISVYNSGVINMYQLGQKYYESVHDGIKTLNYWIQIFDRVETFDNSGNKLIAMPITLGNSVYLDDVFIEDNVISYSYLIYEYNSYENSLRYIGETVFLENKEKKEDFEEPIVFGTVMYDNYFYIFENKKVYSFNINDI